MKKTKIVVAALAVAVFAIQLVPVDRSNPPVETDLGAPAEVARILRTSCYDCHSNETVWPWYSHVAPFSWLVASDTSEARGKLNFSTWNRYSPAQRALLMTRLAHEAGRDMPPWYYTIKHTDARLSDAQRAVLQAWATAK